LSRKLLNAFFPFPPGNAAWPGGAVRSALDPTTASAKIESLRVSRTARARADPTPRAAGPARGGFSA
jgi:hypothetical protein